MSQHSEETPVQASHFEALKKRLYTFSLTALTAGASLILGLLSFGGFYALWPALIPALASFVLSVAYEGEIYRQNIERAFDKLFTADYFEHQLAKEFLCTYIKHEHDNENAAPFFALQRYKLALRHEFEDEATLDAFEAAFSKQLRAETFDSNSKERYAKKLYDLLHAPQPNDAPSLHEQYKARLASRRWPLFSIKAFSIITSLFMGLGTTYLLVELFMLIPMLAAIPVAIWPMIITPMAAIAGLAYGLLTYNAVTNLMANNTLVTWYKKLRDDLIENPFSIKNIGMAITATCLFAMALTLTICTAGTWWTIAKEIPPLFQWMRKIPTVVMGVINPILTGLSSVVFNFENTSETLTMLEALLDENNNDLSIKPLATQLKATLNTLWEKENPLQWLNPFRLILVFGILPMRYVLFVGHLFSIGVTADRIPGLSKYFSAFLGSLSEGFEDVHYFFKHTHPNDLHSLLDERLGESQGHEHNEDIPSWIIRQLAKPFEFFAAAWDSLFSLFNPKENQVSFDDAWNKYAQPASNGCCEDPNCKHQAMPARAPIPTAAPTPKQKSQPVPSHIETPEPPPQMMPEQPPVPSLNTGRCNDPRCTQNHHAFFARGGFAQFCQPVNPATPVAPDPQDAEDQGSNPEAPAPLTLASAR